MSKKPILVNEKELTALIEGLDLKDKQKNEYLKARWLNYVLWWDSRASEARRRYFALRSAVVIAGALLPTIIGLHELNVWAKQAWIFSIAAIIASLVVAICAGVESLFGFGDIWREKRAAAELIKIEGFRFFQLAGEYNQPRKSHAKLYPVFAARVEDIIASEIKDYLSAVKSKEENGSPAGSAVPITDSRAVGVTSRPHRAPAKSNN
jgi:hypothetical protein